MEREAGKRSLRCTWAVFGALLLVAASMVAPTPASAQESNVELVGLTFEYDDAGNALVNLTIRPRLINDIASIRYEFIPVNGGSPSNVGIVSGGPARSLFTVQGVGDGDVPLEPGFYNVALWVTDVNDAVGFDLLAFDLPSAPAVTLTRTGSDAIDVRWTAPEYGFPTAYDVRVSDVFNTQTRTVAASARSASFDQLNQGGLVRVSVTAVSEAVLFDSRFVGRPTARADIALPDLPPAAVENLQSFNQSSQAVGISFDAPIEAVNRYPVTGYRVLIDDGDGTPEIRNYASVPESVTTTRFDDRRYSFSVTPLSEIGDGQTSVIVHQTPPASNPAGPGAADTEPPTIVLSAPAAVSRFGLDVIEYSCNDNAAVASCVGFVNGQPVASGQRIPTALRGVNTITVEALDSAGLETTMEQTVDVDWSLTGPYAGVSGVEGVVARYYAATFERLPDGGGFAFWVDMLSNDPSQAGFVSQFFVTSPEFVSTYGDITDEQFVDRIYRNVLGRESEPGGRAFWLDQLATGTRDRGGIMAFFSNSPEHRQITGTS